MLRAWTAGLAAVLVLGGACELIAWGAAAP